MSIKLETLSATSSLASLEGDIRSFEARGFELITLASGVVGGLPSNTMALRRLGIGNRPGPLTLTEVDPALDIAGQETKVNDQETGAKKLISYAAVFVNGNPTNVGAYRG